MNELGDAFGVCMIIVFLMLAAILIIDSLKPKSDYETCLSRCNGMVYPDRYERIQCQEECKELSLHYNPIKKVIE